MSGESVRRLTLQRKYVSTHMVVTDSKPPFFNIQSTALVSTTALVLDGSSPAAWIAVVMSSDLIMDRTHLLARAENLDERPTRRESGLSSRLF
jgi:hypothetical protein